MTSVYNRARDETRRDRNCRNHITYLARIQRRAFYIDRDAAHAACRRFKEYLLALSRKIRKRALDV